MLINVLTSVLLREVFLAKIRYHALSLLKFFLYYYSFKSCLCITTKDLKLRVLTCHELKLDTSSKSSFQCEIVNQFIIIEEEKKNRVYHVVVSLT